MSDEQYNPCLIHGIRRCTICIANPVDYVVLDVPLHPTTHGDPAEVLGQPREDG